MDKHEGCECEQKLVGNHVCTYYLRIMTFIVAFDLNYVHLIVNYCLEIYITDVLSHFVLIMIFPYLCFTNFDCKCFYLNPVEISSVTAVIYILNFVFAHENYSYYHYCQDVSVNDVVISVEKILKMYIIKVK